MKQYNNIKPLEILLVEDNPADVRLTIEALKESPIKTNLHTVEDGVEALAFLRKGGKYKDATIPDLILLDLNMPKKNGREVLKEIKHDRSLKRIPVVVLTISSAEEDIAKSYENFANCYIIKPLDLNQFVKNIHNIIEFWALNVKLTQNYDNP